MSDSNKVVKEDLNPNYFRYYELDCEFPEYWQLDIKIINDGLATSLIGGVSFDLEDRYYGNLENKQLLAYAIYYREHNMRKKELEKSWTQEDKILKDQEQATCNQLRNKMADLPTSIEGLVEFKPLTKPDNFTSQGTIEFCLSLLRPQLGK